MYKVFVNDKPLLLTNELQKETDFSVFLLESVDIRQVVVKLFENKIQKAYLYHPDEKEIMRKLKSKIPVAKAAGGLVRNDKGETLFIFRNRKWDLPKGGIEKGEGRREAAIREVEEETGVKGLSIVGKLEKTYHIFKRNGRFKLKVTHWYEMKSSYSGNFTPQLEEGIEKVAWLGPEDIEQALQNSYENIKLLFEEQLAGN